MRCMLSALIVGTVGFLVAAPAAAGWSWPADGPVLRPFSLTADAYAAGQHRGIDVGVAVGEPVRAPAAGTVSFVGSLPGGGRAITIQTADGYAVTLLQLGSVATARGSAVAEGAVVGSGGASEDAATLVPHVHLGVRVASDADGYVDPLGLLPQRTTTVAPAPAPPSEAPAAPVPAPTPASPAQEPEPSAEPQSAPAAAAVEAPTPAPAAAGLPTTAPSAPARVRVAAPAGARARAGSATAPPAHAADPVRPVTVAGPAPVAEPEPVSAPGPRRTAPVRDLRAARLVAASDRPLRRAAHSSPPVAAPRARIAATVQEVPESTATPRDAVRPHVAARATTRATSPSHGGLVDGRLLALACLGLLAVACLGVRVARGPTPIMDTDELLPDDTDLLRQLDAAPGSCLHDDRGGHPRAPSRAAGGADVLPHGGGRACGQGGAGGCSGGAGAAGVRRSHRPRVAGARTARQRPAGLLHQNHR